MARSGAARSGPAAALIEKHSQVDFDLVRVGRGVNRTEEDSEKLIEPLEAG